MLLLVILLVRENLFPPSSCSSSTRSARVKCTASVGINLKTCKTCGAAACVGAAQFGRAAQCFAPSAAAAAAAFAAAASFLIFGGRFLLQHYH